MRTTMQIMREIVEPLRESWQRELATFELARLIREKAFDVGVEAREVPFLRTTLHLCDSLNDLYGVEQT